MASAEVGLESGTESVINPLCMKDGVIINSEPICGNDNSCHLDNDKIQPSNVVPTTSMGYGETKSNYSDVTVKNDDIPLTNDVNHNNTSDLEVKVNGLKSDSIEETELRIKNRPLHVDAESWPFKTNEESNTEKLPNTHVPYTYGPKFGTVQHGSPKSFGNRNFAKRQYDNSNLCSQSSSAVNNTSTCPNSGKNEHVVLLHVNPGETISFYMNDHTQLIQGPATVRMVSCSSTPPIPVPVQVPPGHMVQQLADENWTLREIILSPQPPVGVPVGGHYNAGSSYGSGSSGAPAGPLPLFVYPHYSYPPPIQYHTHMQPGMTNHSMHAGHVPPHSTNQGTNGQGQYAPVNPPIAMHKDDRTQKQFYKLKKRLEARQKDSSSLRSDGNSSYRNDGPLRVNFGHDVEKHELSSNQSKIYEFLSTVSKPNVSEITGRSALASWAALNVDNEKDKPDVLDNIKPENILYNLLISEKGPDVGKKVAYCGKLLEYQLKDLKPGSSYYISIQASLDEVCGKSSESITFRTSACKPEVPQPPKLQSRTKTSLSLKWNAASDNGSRILNYILEYDEGLGGNTFTEAFSGLQKQFKAVKLKVSTFYRFRLAAENELGKSDFSEAVCFSTSGSAPSQPSEPQIIQTTCNSISLKWEARPNDDSFTLQMEAENSLHGFLPVYNGKDTYYKCCDLQRNCEYKFRLSANNEEGSSAWSQPVVTNTLPEAPIATARPTLKGKLHATNFKVSWGPPRDDGGSPILSYELEIDKGTGFEIAYNGPDEEFVCEGLEPGTAYFLRVRSKTKGGTSLFSEPCCIQTLAVVPGKCQTPRALGKPKATHFHIKWAPPDYNGGSEVQEYEVEVTDPDSIKRQVYKGHGTDCVVAGLLPGRTYAVCVRAVNKIGHGPYSDALEILTGAGSPDVPKDVLAVPRAPHSIYVSWTEPSNNGSPITEYRLETSSNGTAISAYNGLQCNAEVKNLIPATCYSFRVQAVNSAGAGTFSEHVKCQTPPSSPGSIVGTTVKVVACATSICMSWKEPNDHGSSISSYNVEIGDSISTAVDQPEITVENLTPETTYRVRIQAVNNFGLGPFTSLKVVTRGLPPNPPLLECSGFSHNSLRLKWGDGKNPDFIQYTLEMLHPHTGNFAPIFQGTGQFHKVSRLDECSKYDFRIHASNNEGNGPYSNVFTFTTLKTVPPTPKPPKVTSMTETSCAIEWWPTKSIGDDMMSYKLQLGSKTFDYNVVYTGIQTTFNLCDLRPGTEYSVRLASIRHCTDGTGELSSLFSPSTVFCTNSPITKTPVHKPVASSSWADREPLTDQQWAIIILFGFTFFAIFFAILTQWILSYLNS